MAGFSRMLLVIFLCLGMPATAQKQSQQPSEEAAARVFGPRWRQLSCDSGIIFSGTVLEIRSVRPGPHKQIPTMKIRFRVERAIAGVHARQVVTIREWAGAWSEHSLNAGQHVLLLLYPQSRLGLTSPVGGSLGQVTLSNKNTVMRPVFVADNRNGSQLGDPTESESGAPITLSQLEQAIRNARHSQQITVSHGRTPGRGDL